MLQNSIKMLKNEGVAALFIRKYRNLRFRILRFLYYGNNDHEEWKRLKGKYKGKRVFIVGNGPSLNKTPLYLLKDEYTMCFNRFEIMLERLNWTPTFFMSVDYLVMVDLIKEIDEILKHCEYAFFPKVHYEGKLFFKMLKKTEKILWLKPLIGRGFSLEMPGTYNGGTVVYNAMQVLNYLGFDEIILLGVDMNYQIHQTASSLNSYSVEVKSNNDDDPNHFDPRYFGKGKSYHQPKQFIIDNILRALDYLGKNQTKFGTNIINAGYDSKVESFPKKDFMSFFNYSDGEIKQIFEKMISDHSNYSTIEEFEERTCEYSDSSSIEALRNIDFYTSMDNAIKIYKQIIFTHIPLGPYGEKYYFIRRKNID